ncbi:MAG: hypothetical protein HOW97_02495 [Catenulispora sp.]|nr:hypothetical protein [Catenulispora sp.]
MAKTLAVAPNPEDSARSLNTFDFHGHQAAVFTDDRGHWIFPKQISGFMGIDAENQRKRILRNHWSEGWTATMAVQVPGDTQAREHFLLHQRRLPMWLGSITTSNIKDRSTRARVEEHQTEFADALADYLTKGVAINPRAAVGDDLDVIEGMVRAIRADRRRLAAVEEAQVALAAKVDAIEGRHGWFTALAHAKLHDHSTERSYLSRVGSKASAICRALGIKPHPREDATFGTVNTYPVHVLEQAFAEVTP